LFCSKQGKIINHFDKVEGKESGEETESGEEETESGEEETGGE
jgi:hypothetical protein